MYAFVPRLRTGSDVAGMAGSGGERGGAVEKWSGAQVQAFVRGLKEDFGDRADDYAEAMVREDVDGRVLLQLQQVFSCYRMCSLAIVCCSSCCRLFVPSY